MSKLISMMWLLLAISSIGITSCSKNDHISTNFEGTAEVHNGKSGPASDEVATEPKLPIADDKGNEEEATLENGIAKIVSSSGRRTARPLTGKWARTPIIIVPKKIEEYYLKDRLSTLKCLRKIVKEGTVSDAISAGGYAIALAENPFAGFSVSCWSEKKYEEPSKALGISMRGLVIQSIDKHISKEENRLKE
jgi:hypothetical protein